ncbi:unnamed protein product [Paramecium primaurelia]|uniref:FCP1 homology domain-containing protein n=1 Tax=Paramecium primaurelia TaxID=5886 RepID=A0A8S1K2B0_PARPR|nr:unnamed protein product [Paramecium primaurelia]
MIKLYQKICNFYIQYQTYKYLLQNTNQLLIQVLLRIKRKRRRKGLQKLIRIYLQLFMFRKQLKSVDDKKTNNQSPYRLNFFNNQIKNKRDQDLGQAQDILNRRRLKKKESLSISNTFHFDDQQPASFNSFFVHSQKKKQIKDKLVTEIGNCGSYRKRVETLQTQQFSDDDARLHIDRQNERLRLKLYFSFQKMQIRLVNLINLIQQIDVCTLNIYISEISSGTIEIIGGYYRQYKRFMINECIGLVFYLMIKRGILTGIDINKWEKLLIYSHQANTIQTITSLKLQIKGVQQYLHQFQQFQSMNPLIPSQIEKMNLLIEQNIDKLLKNTQDKQVQQHLQAYRDSQIDAAFQFYQQKLKVIIVNLERFLFLLPKSSTVYTLVLDLDETLVHFIEETQEVLIRPYTEIFLEQMGKHFEIVIFTAGIQSYADKIIDKIDIMNVVKHRLYRHHTFSQGNVMLKDLSTLGRPLSKTIIVDNNPYNFVLQPHNGIKIKAWIGDEKDRALVELMQFLIKLTKYEDIRIGLKELKANPQYFTTSF